MSESKTYNDWFYDAQLQSMIHLDRAKDMIQNAKGEVNRAVELEPDLRIKKALRKTQRHIDDLFAELEDLL